MKQYIISLGKELAYQQALRPAKLSNLDELIPPLAEVRLHV
jgi:hypothetical protein